MSIKKWLPLLVVAVLSIGVSYGIIQYNNKKIAVVDAIQVFNAFNMKKELEGKAEARLKYLGAQLDSMQRTIEQQQKDKKDNREVYQQFQYKKEQIQKEYAESNQLINEMVWKRLNPLIDAYGKEQGFRVIVGANGMGSVLYYNDYYDVTEDLITYVNQKYEGKE